MAKTIAGIGLTAIVLFIFGFLYWGISPLPYTALNSAADQKAALADIKRHFPDTGAYMVPAAANMELLAKGSQAVVYVDHEVPASQPDPQAMALGFVHNILMAVVVFLLLRNQEGMSQHLRTGALVGLAAVVVIEGSDTLWWLYPLSWKIHSVVYHFLCFVLAAALLSKFVPASQE